MMSVESLPARLDMAGRRFRRRTRFAGPTSYAFLAPAAVLFVVFIAYPILWVVEQSLFAKRAGQTVFVGLAAYAETLADPVFWTVVRNMLLWGAITVPVQMLIGGVIAYFIERHTHRL